MKQYAWFDRGEVNTVLGILWEIESPPTPGGNTLVRDALVIYLHNGYDRVARDSFYEESIRTILIAVRNNEQASCIRCKREW